MVYILLAIGIGLIILGAVRGRNTGDPDFADILSEIEMTDELRLVNHTISEEELSDGLSQVVVELAGIKNTLEKQGRRLEQVENKLMMQGKANDVNPSTPEKYKDASQKLDSLRKPKSIDELSKEMEIGKGELQLLQKLQKK